MDWPLENAGLSDSDLTKVFRYAPHETTVIRLLTTDHVGSSRWLNVPIILIVNQGPRLWLHATPDDWKTWLQQVRDRFRLHQNVP